jgi:hypothetical protein
VLKDCRKQKQEKESKLDVLIASYIKVPKSNASPFTALMKFENIINNIIPRKDRNKSIAVELKRLTTVLTFIQYEKQIRELTGKGVPKIFKPEPELGSVKNVKDDEDENQNEEDEDEDEYGEFERDDNDSMEQSGGEGSDEHFYTTNPFGSKAMMLEVFNALERIAYFHEGTNTDLEDKLFDLLEMYFHPFWKQQADTLDSTIGDLLDIETDLNGNSDNEDGYGYESGGTAVPDINNLQLENETNFNMSPDEDDKQSPPSSDSSSPSSSDSPPSSSESGVEDDEDTRPYVLQVLDYIIDVWRYNTLLFKNVELGDILNESELMFLHNTYDILMHKLGVLPFGHNEAPSSSN